MAKNALKNTFRLVLLAGIIGAGIFFSTDAVKPPKKIVTVKAEYAPESVDDGHEK